MFIHINWRGGEDGEKSQNELLNLKVLLIGVHVASLGS